MVLKVKKEVKKEVKNKFLLDIINLLEKGFNPSKIALKLNITKQRLNYYIATLKRNGTITKLGYGVWQITSKKEVKTNTVTYSNNGRDTLRGHAFQFKLKLPKNFRNWDKREEILIKLGTTFKPLFIGGIKRGQRLTLDNKKIWLTNKSIVIYDNKSYHGDLATEIKKAVIESFFNTVNKLETLLKANFGNYTFSIVSNHYSLIKNGLAEYYNEDKKKFKVFGDDGKLIFLIDNSFNLNEFEAVHPKTAENDIKIAQDFFKSLVKHPLTPEQIKIITAQLSENQFEITQVLRQMENNFKELMKQFYRHLAEHAKE